MKVLKIKDIVRTISITHKFDKDKLIAINTSDVENGIMHDGTLTAIEDLKGQFKKTVQKGDILFSEIRPANRRFALVTKDDCADYVVSTKLMVLRKYNNEVDLRYFYYCLTNQPFLDMLQRKAENRIGSFPQITFDLLSEYAFPVPSLSEQEKIANIIFSLDHKIELNKQINDNLEEMAKQLYDYWFVQFDFPNEEGMPYKSSGGEMVWNEKLKREIPKGWEVKHLGDIIETNRGISYNTSSISGGGVPMINLASFNVNGTYKDAGIKTYNGSYTKEKVLKPFDLVLCNTQQTAIDFSKDIIGKAFLVPDVFEGDIVSSHHINTIKTEDYYKAYIAYLSNTSHFHKYAAGCCSGTNILGLDFNSFSQYKIEIPPVYLLEEFQKLIIDIVKRESVIIKENKTLTKLRDELLPLLMNGQASVNYHLSDD